MSRSPRTLVTEHRLLDPPRRRALPDVVAEQRRIVAQAAEIHRAEGCRTCPVIRASQGDEEAFREVVNDALRRRNERLGW